VQQAHHKGLHRVEMITNKLFQGPASLCRNAVAMRLYLSANISLLNRARLANSVGNQSLLTIVMCHSRRALTLNRADCGWALEANFKGCSE
jgi:hypothetical protein